MGVIDQLFLYRHNSLASFCYSQCGVQPARAHDRGVAHTAAAWAVNSRPANGGRHGHSLLLHRYYCCTPKTGGFTGDEPIHANIAQYATTTTRLVSLPVVAAAAAVSPVALPPLAASPLRVDDFILLYYVEQTSRLKNKVREKKMFKSLA